MPNRCGTAVSVTPWLYRSAFRAAGSGTLLALSAPTATEPALSGVRLAVVAAYMSLW
jgi:hypothetical protein